MKVINATSQLTRSAVVMQHYFQLFIAVSTENMPINIPAKTIHYKR